MATGRDFPRTERPHVAEPEAPGRASRALRDQDLPGVGRLLEARSRVHRVARDHPDLGSHVAGRDDVTRVDAGAHGQAHAISLLEIEVELDEATTHSERGAERPRGVVLVRHGHAEDGHYGVADELLDGAAFALDLLSHRGCVGAENVLQVLRIEPLAERRGARDVGEEDRDELALRITDALVAG